MQEFPFTTSFWFDPEIETSPSLDATRSVDVAIIGGGFSGLSTALHLKRSKPGLNIAIIESKHVGYGASGRNAGWLMSLPPLYWLLDNFDDPQRLSDIRWVSQICRDNILALSKLIERETINCNWTPSQHVLVARNPLEVATLRWIAPRFESIGMGYEFFEKGNVHELVGYPATAALAYDIVTIQPYRLSKGLRDHCVRQGVWIYENTPVTHLHATKQGVQLIVANGNCLTAQKVIWRRMRIRARYRLALRFHQAPRNIRICLQQNRWTGTSLNGSAKAESHLGTRPSPSTSVASMKTVSCSTALTANHKRLRRMIGTCQPSPGCMQK
jgi:hypothetical protein